MYTKRIAALALAFMIGIATWASEQHRSSQEAVLDELGGVTDVLPAAKLKASADC